MFQTPMLSLLFREPLLGFFLPLLRVFFPLLFVSNRDHEVIRQFDSGSFMSSTHWEFFDASEGLFALMCLYVLICSTNFGARVCVGDFSAGCMFEKDLTLNSTMAKHSTESVNSQSDSNDIALCCQTYNERVPNIIWKIFRQVQRRGSEYDLEDPYSIPKCMKVLDAMDIEDMQLYYRFRNMLLNRDIRQVFMTMPPERRLGYIRYLCG